MIPDSPPLSWPRGSFKIELCAEFHFYSLGANSLGDFPSPFLPLSGSIKSIHAVMGALGGVAGKYRAKYI